MSINGWFNPPGTDLIIPYMVLNSFQELGEFYTYINEKSNLGYRIPTANKYLTGTIKVKMDGQLTGDGWFPTYSSKESFISGLLSKTTPLYLSGKLIGMLSPKSPTCIVGDSEIECGQRYGGAYTSDGVFIHSTFSLDDDSLSMYSVYPIMYSYAGYISFVLIFSSNNGESWGTSSIGSSPQCRMTDMDTFTNSLFDVTLLNGNLAPFDDVYDSLFNKKPYEPGGTSGPSGGGGGFGKDEISDSIFGDLPSGSVDAQDSATGMYTRYLMNSSYLDLLGDWVWDPNLGLSLIQTAIKPFFNDPEQALISLISFPFQLSAPLVGISTRSQPCYFGHQPTGATFVALTTQSAQINWGTIDLQEYWGNFLDYAPHTKIELYLPWGTGFVNLDPGQCLPGTLTVITNIELQRGSCVHNVVNSAGCVIGSYAGQCGKQIPLIASDIAAKRAGLVTAAAGALVAGAAIAAAPSAMASGYSAGIASSGIVSASRVSAISTQAAAQYRADVASSFGMKGAESALNTVEKGAKAGANIASKSSVASLKTPASVQRNGGFTDGSAGMGIQYPYIILSRPEQNVPENYGHHFGYPSNVYVRLSSLRGYTEIGSIHLDSIPATNAELEELDGILKGGVIF